MPAASRIRATATPAAPAPEIDDPGLLVGPAGERERALEGGERDDRGAVLVVVEDRDVEPLLEPLLDLEAPRCGDVLEVDPAEARGEPDDGLDDLVGVGGVEADRDRVDAAELLEQDRLALHHRHRGGGADVAEAEHRGAVGDDGDGVGDPGVVVDQRRLRGDRLAHLGDARRVGERQVVAVVERHGGGDLHLPARVQREHRRPGASARLLGGGGRDGHRGTFAIGDESVWHSRALQEDVGPVARLPHPVDALARREPPELDVLGQDGALVGVEQRTDGHVRENLRVARHGDHLRSGIVAEP